MPPPRALPPGPRVVAPPRRGQRGQEPFRPIFAPPGRKAPVADATAHEKTPYRALRRVVTLASHSRGRHSLGRSAHHEQTDIFTYERSQRRCQEKSFRKFRNNRRLAPGGKLGMENWRPPYDSYDSGDTIPNPSQLRLASPELVRLDSSLSPTGRVTPPPVPTPTA